MQTFVKEFDGNTSSELGTPGSCGRTRLACSPGLVLVFRLCRNLSVDTYHEFAW